MVLPTQLIITVASYSSNRLPKSPNSRIVLEIKTVVGHCIALLLPPKLKTHAKFLNPCRPLYSAVSRLGTRHHYSASVDIGFDLVSSSRVHRQELRCEMNASHSRISTYVYISLLYNTSLFIRLAQRNPELRLASDDPSDTHPKAEMKISRSLQVVKWTVAVVFWKAPELDIFTAVSSPEL